MKVLTVPQSGSLAGQTASRNRFGQYLRNRAIPVNPATTFQGVARAFLSAAAAAWRALTDLQRTGWSSLGLSMTRTDSLGQSYTLTGQQAFVSVNSLKNNAGDTTLADAPSLTTPDAISSGTLTVAPAGVTFSYGDTLAANERLFIYASPQRSAGRNFENDLRLIHVSATAATSPAVATSGYTARFGTPVSGNKIFVAVHRYSDGFISGPRYASDVVA